MRQHLGVEKHWTTQIQHWMPQQGGGKPQRMEKQMQTEDRSPKEEELETEARSRTMQAPFVSAVSDEAA